MGIGAGVYLDCATFSFHVPIVLSAPKAATVVIARAKTAVLRIVRICQAPLNFGGDTWLSEIQWCRTTTRIWTAGGKLENTLIAPNSIALRSALVSDHITAGGFGFCRGRGDQRPTNRH